MKYLFLGYINVNRLLSHIHLLFITTVNKPFHVTGTGCPSKLRWRVVKLWKVRKELQVRQVLPLKEKLGNTRR